MILPTTPYPSTQRPLKTRENIRNCIIETIRKILNRPKTMNDQFAKTDNGPGILTRYPQDIVRQLQKTLCYPSNQPSYRLRVHCYLQKVADYLWRAATYIRRIN